MSMLRLCPAICSLACSLPSARSFCLKSSLVNTALFCVISSTLVTYVANKSSDGKETKAADAPAPSDVKETKDGKDGKESKSPSSRNRRLPHTDKEDEDTPAGFTKREDLVTKYSIANRFVPRGEALLHHAFAHCSVLGCELVDVFRSLFKGGEDVALQKAAFTQALDALASLNATPNGRLASSGLNAHRFRAQLSPTTRCCEARSPP